MSHFTVWSNMVPLSECKHRTQVSWVGFTHFSVKWRNNPGLGLARVRVGVRGLGLGLTRLFTQCVPSITVSFWSFICFLFTFTFSPCMALFPDKHVEWIFLFSEKKSSSQCCETCIIYSCYYWQTATFNSAAPPPNVFFFFKLEQNNTPWKWIWKEIYLIQRRLHPVGWLAFCVICFLVWCFCFFSPAKSFSLQNQKNGATEHEVTPSNILWWTNSPKNNEREARSRGCLVLVDLSIKQHRKERKK